MTPGIPAEVREFVSAMFGAPEQLDVFLLLHGGGDRTWTAEQVSASLAMAPESAAMRLFLLTANGLLTGTGGREPLYRYESEPTLDRLSAQLAESYAAAPGELRALAGSSPRPDPVRQFAQAFKVRKP
jgi:hypothetical protein